MASAAPWLVALSEYKLATFSVTAAALVYSWWQVRKVAASCSIADAKRMRMQKWVLRGATLIFGVSVLAAYALLPLMMWFDNS